MELLLQLTDTGFADLLHSCCSPGSEQSPLLLPWVLLLLQVMQASPLMTC